MNTELEQLLKEWDDPHGYRDVSAAEDLIHALQVELAGKEELIKVLTEDIKYYRKDWKDQMIQDQGLSDE